MRTPEKSYRVNEGRMIIARNTVPQSGEALLSALYEYAFRQRIAQV